jgi:putative spermidine/putrescine transport system substrate-binding protein
VLLVAGGGLYWLLRPAATLDVVSWGGAYGRAQTLAYFHPYADRTRVDVLVGSYGGGLKEIASQEAAHDVRWDVVDMEWEDAASACRQGLLERLDGLELPPGANGALAARDFVPGALGPCWVGSAVYSQVIGFDTARYADRPPARLADFFDLAAFPGPRALRDDGPKYNLELALMADGVPPWQVYSVLATREGQDRAFAKLDTIKPVILWWKRVAEPAEMLTKGTAAMATVLNARISDPEAVPKIGTLWDGQLYQFDVFAIPKGDPRKQRALDFIRFATGPEPLAEAARYLPYGPARRSALALVGRNPDTNEDMRPHLPTAPENFARALAVDPDWWAHYGPELETRWTRWRNAAPPAH